MKSKLSQNLSTLRKYHKYTQEEVAEKIGVTRQAIAKWESGDSAPDLVNCDSLAELYGVTLDDLIHFDEKREQMMIPPKGKHIFGTVTVGERGQIVLPQKAREMMRLSSGDLLVVLGDESPESFGLAFVPAERFLNLASEVFQNLRPERELRQEEI